MIQKELDDMTKDELISEVLKQKSKNSALVTRLEEKITYTQKNIKLNFSSDDDFMSNYIKLKEQIKVKENALKYNISKFKKTRRVLRELFDNNFDNMNDDQIKLELLKNYDVYGYGFVVDTLGYNIHQDGFCIDKEYEKIKKKLKEENKK